MTRLFILTIACVIALSAGAEGASRRKRPAPSPQRALPNRPVQEPDEFRSCDVAVRDYIQGRKEAAALLVKEVKADGLRMTLSFVHPYGESGDTAPNLAFTRGESIEERRKALNEVKQRVRALAEAAKTGNVWYVIALGNDALDGRGPASVQQENRSTASAMVMANIDDRCISVYEYKAVSLDSLSDELRGLLGVKGREPPSTEGSASVPQQGSTEAR